MGAGEKAVKTLKDKFITLEQTKRLYELPVPVIGLTGGISTGKSTVAKMLEQQGLSVIDADHLVKSIYKMDETKKYVQKNHPEVIVNQEINFKALREKVFKDAKVKQDIEAFIYQRLPEAFMAAYKALPSPALVVYDVPLLFEKKMEGMFDVTVLVYAPRNIQKARLMVRDGHLEDMADVILKQQMDIEEKKEKAGFVINNKTSMEDLSTEVSQFLNQILN